ncbi:Hypp6392 [Branchiostoma lanceolatum]|uniref:Hypp6392 protein n=1 Tax=Branchiostoma lanceolatum TaxID=7740 RepID=A0A8K0EA33_BRALA|nr:Hypp6392 [Branchiostoma lanceolatum]
MEEGYSLKPPSALDVHSRNLSVTWKRWKEKVTLYLDLTVEDAVKKKKTFLYLIGEDARKVYETLTFVNAENAPIAEKDRTVEQVMTFDQYLTELRTLAAECGFGAIKDSLIRDRILCGISDGKVRERLLRESDLTLKRCGEICKAAEISRKSIQTTPNGVKLREQEVPFHGHLITSQGLKLDPGKVAAIAKMPRPTDAQAVQRLVGFVTYLAKFLQKLKQYIRDGFPEKGKLPASTGTLLPRQRSTGIIEWNGVQGPVRSCPENTEIRHVEATTCITHGD